MTRPGLFRIYALAAIAVALSEAVYLAPRRDPLTLLFFTALVALTAFLDVEVDGAMLGFESAVVFAAIILLHDPAVALIPVLVGTLRSVRLSALVESAERALSYFVVAILYTSAVEHSAPLGAKISGYVLLLVGYLAASLGFTALRRSLVGETVDPLRFLRIHGRMLLLLTPIVVLEILSDSAYGRLGFTIAFCPAIVVAVAIRKTVRAEQRNVELTGRNRELSILTESATRVLAADTEDETLRRLASLLGQLARLKACAVVTWDASGEPGGTVYRFGECRPTDQEILRWVDTAGFSQSAPSRPFVFQDELRRFPLSAGPAIQIIIGIQTGEVIYGILIYETDDPSILKSDSLNLLTLLVNQIDVSLQDQVLRDQMRGKTEQLEKQAATMSTILDVSTSLIGSFDLDAGLTRIATAIRDALGFRVVIFAVRDARSGDFMRRAQVGLDDVWEDMRKTPVAASAIELFLNSDFRISNSYFVSHTALQPSEHGVFIRSDEAQSWLDEWHDNDMLIVPLGSGEEMIGYLTVRDPHDRALPTSDKVKTLEIFAVQAVTALQSARQYEEIRRLTFVDGLTLAYNYRFFQEALAKEIHRHQRTGSEFTLAMLDIDNFKRINDTFGHPIGDEILKGLVAELMTNARESDVVSRYGGEEFAIIFPDTPGGSAVDAGNRMRELVEQRSFLVPQINRTLRVTVSLGLAIFPRDATTATDLIARADAALYFAKKSGKNQVAMARDVPASDAGYGG